VTLVTRQIDSHHRQNLRKPSIKSQREKAMKPVLAVSPVSAKKILFATDFSDQSNMALPYAVSAARKHGAKIYALHVLPEPLGLPAGMREGLHAMGTHPPAENSTGIADLGTRLACIPHEILSRRGDIWSEVAKLVDANKIDLIVMGTHGRSGVGKVLLGSVAERVFRQAACPVLTVGPSVSGEPSSIADLHEILFATDFSPESLVALPHAISLAVEHNARLYLLHVMSDQLAPEAESLAKRELLELIPPTAKLSSEPKAFVEYGAPAEKILAIAEELATDLIVLGVKRIPLHFEPSTHLPLATAYKVVSQAICPVLTVRS
jgi:nucleotide-binding universal stress UspA family protein